MDSVRTGADGAFRIPYRPYGPADAIYFVATKWAGIAYFSTPLRDPGVEQHAVLTVFDTTSAGAPLPVQGRHVVVFAPKPDGSREVAEVYEIANNDAKTRVAPGAGKPSWSAPIPASATAFRAGESDVSAGMIVGSAGKAEVFAPFAPGIKQIRFIVPAADERLPAHAARRCAIRRCSRSWSEEQGASASGAGLQGDGSGDGGRAPVRALALARTLAAGAVGDDHGGRRARPADAGGGDGARRRARRDDDHRAPLRTAPPRLTRSGAGAVASMHN